MVLLVACSSHDEADEVKERCVALRDHLVELRLDGATVDVEKHRQALRAALGNAFIEQCRHLPTNQVNCEMHALDPQAAAACAPPVASN